MDIEKVSKEIGKNSQEKGKAINKASKEINAEGRPGFTQELSKPVTKCHKGTTESEHEGHSCTGKFAAGSADFS